MATDISTQFVREAPEIEAQKLALMQSAKAQVDAINKAAQEGRFLAPSYQIASFAPDQVRAIEAARMGIGAYQPYLTAATQGMMGGQETVGMGVEALRGADTRGQFRAAQEALNRSVMPLQQMGMAARGLIGGQNVIGQGIGTLYGGMQAYQPQSYQAFMNPYQQAVIDESIRQINRQGDITRQGLQAQAAKAGAFGGSRDLIQRGMLERSLMGQRNAAITSALQQGYGAAQQQAQQAFEQQQQRQLQAAQAMAAAGTQYGQLGAQQANIYGQQSQLGQQLGQGIGALAGQQFGIGQQLAQGLGALGGQQAALGGQLAALGAQQQGLGQQDVNFLYNLGAQQQRQQQAVLDAQRQNQLQQSTQPIQMLGFLSDIYKGAPTTQMAMTQQNQAAPSPFQQIAGLGIGATAAAAAAAKAGLF